IAQHVKATKSFHPNIEFVLLTLGLHDDVFSATSFEVEHLSGEQRTELAKFMLALPYLEVRRARIDDALWPFVLQNISDEERKAWRTACRVYVHKGTPF
ncbi:MAG: hypothetical protein ACO3NY_08340, partial [Poseidonia sp.]